MSDFARRQPLKYHRVPGFCRHCFRPIIRFRADSFRFSLPGEMWNGIGVFFGGISLDKLL